MGFLSYYRERLYPHHVACGISEFRARASGHGAARRSVREPASPFLAGRCELAGPEHRRFRENSRTSPIDRCLPAGAGSAQRWSIRHVRLGCTDVGGSRSQEKSARGAVTRSCTFAFSGIAFAADGPRHQRGSLIVTVPWAMAARRPSLTMSIRTTACVRDRLMISARAATVPCVTGAVRLILNSVVAPH